MSRTSFPLFLINRYCIKMALAPPAVHSCKKKNLLSWQVLFRLEERKAASLGLALLALQKQLSRLPVPFSQQQEAADEYGVCRCCSALAAFLKAFIEEVMTKNGSYITSPEHKELRTELLKL